MQSSYTPFEIILGIIVALATLTFIFVVVGKSIINERRKRAMKQWREEHGLPFLGELEEETELERWGVEYHGLPSMDIKTFFAELFQKSPKNYF